MKIPSADSDLKMYLVEEKNEFGWVIRTHELSSSGPDACTA